MFRINHNIASLNSRRHLGNTEKDVRGAVERLSSGLRINHAAEDPAALFVSEQMRAQLAAARQANRNVAQAIAMLQTMEGGLEQLTDMFVRLKELAIQAADGSYSDSQRSLGIQVEAEELVSEIDRILDGITFNGIGLFNPPPPTLTFQVGELAQDRLGFTLDTVDTDVLLGSFTSRFTALGGTLTAAYVDIVSIPDLLTQIGSAIDFVVAARARVGAFQNRLERTGTNLEVQIENVTNAESIIRDADMATETSALVRAQILVQSGTSVLNQANLMSQNILTLLQAIG